MSSEEESDEFPEESVPESAVPARNFAEAPVKRPGAAVNLSFFGRAGQFIKDVRSEMKRVSWPTFEDVRNTTIIVLVNVVFFAVFLFVVDLGWGYTIRGFDWVVNKLFGVA